MQDVKVPATRCIMSSGGLSAFIVFTLLNNILQAVDSCVMICKGILKLFLVLH
jgi:hypothetical protein